jgi:hypothetical protein
LVKRSCRHPTNTAATTAIETRGNMDKDAAVIVGLIAGLLITVFGGLAYSMHLRQECVKILKDKPAAEIKVVCAS